MPAQSCLKLRTQTAPSCLKSATIYILFLHLQGNEILLCDEGDVLSGKRKKQCVFAWARCMPSPTGPSKL